MKSSSGDVASVATTKKKAGVNDIDFSCFPPQSHRVMSRSIVATAAPSSARAVKITQSQTSPVPTGNDKGRDGKSSSSKTQTAGTVPKPILGAFNQGGSHMHNHLKFLCQQNMAPPLPIAMRRRRAIGVALAVVGLLFLGGVGHFID